MTPIRSMIPLSAAWLVCFSIAIAPGCSGTLFAATYDVFTSEEDQFRVDMPGVPELETTDSRGGDQNSSKLREWILFDNDSVRYSVSTQKADLQGEAIDRFLALLRISKIAERGDSDDLRSDRKLNLKGGIKAVEIEMPLGGDLSDKASVRTRFFVANGKVYILSVAGLFDDVRSKTANRFFDSFEVLSSTARPARKLTGSKNATTVDKEKTKLQKFTFVSDGFEVSFPSKPTENEQNVNQGQGDPVIQKQYIVEANGGTYMVSAQPSSIGDSSDSIAIEAAFDRVTSSLTQVFSGEVLQENDIEFAKGVPAREIRISIPKPTGEYRTLVLFSNDRFYQVIAIGAKEFVNNREVDEFFQSFRLLGEISSKGADSGQQVYQSALGGFKATLPSRPVYSRHSEVDGMGRTRIQHRYLCEGKDSEVLVCVTEYEGLCGMNASQINAVCESAVRRMAGNQSVERLVHVPSKANSYEWQYRCSATKSGTTSRGRLVVANDRIFVIQASGSNDYHQNASSEGTLQSMEVTIDDTALSEKR